MPASRGPAGSTQERLYEAAVDCLKTSIHPCSELMTVVAMSLGVSINVVQPSEDFKGALEVHCFEGTHMVMQRRGSDTLQCWGQDEGIRSSGRFQI